MATKCFVYVVRLVRPEAATDATAEEEAVLEQHFAYLQRALREGRLLLAGPCEDAAFGIVLFEASSEADAEAFMRGDPAVAQGVMRAELHAFRISLARDRLRQAPSAG